jgi:hypothetical protein
MYFYLFTSLFRGNYSFLPRRFSDCYRNHISIATNVKTFAKLL